MGSYSTSYFVQERLLITGITFEVMPFGRAPVLEVDGTMIAGSINILKYLGTKFGETMSIDNDNSVASRDASVTTLYTVVPWLAN